MFIYARIEIDDDAGTDQQGPIVRIDDRAYDTTDERCNCIPAADNPKVSSAKDATWLKDEEIVFGIEVNGEYRAYPRRIM